MATRAHHAEPVIALPPTLAFVLGVPAAPRSAVEAVIERMIDALDQIDGDPDAERTSDEAEPDFARVRRTRKYGPGCNISDPDFAVDDQPCDEPFQDLEEELGVHVAEVTNCHLFALEPDPVTGQRACLGMSNPGDHFQGRLPGGDA